MEREKLIRLNKFLAHAGIGTRRECDQLISAGLIKVNDLLIDKPGSKISINDIVTFNNEIVQAGKKVYILLNKPKNISSFPADEKENKSIYYLTYNFAEKLKIGYRPEIKPLDILEVDERGLIVITNDNSLLDLASNNKIKQIFKIELDRQLSEKDYNSIVKKSNNSHIKNIELLDEDDDTIIGIDAMISGTKTINDTFKDLSCNIEVLDRTAYGFLTKKDLPRGKWRFLNLKEINRLKLLYSSNS